MIKCLDQHLAERGSRPGHRQNEKKKKTPCKTRPAHACGCAVNKPKVNLKPHTPAAARLTRPRCGLNRALKLTVTHTVQLCFCYCFYLYANVQLVKRDIVTAVIYCYITTDFYYAKRDSRLSAYRGVMLQGAGIDKNVNRHFSLKC